jgi:3-hydroxy acid dehydrogenase / malonic semialdehyde reductase
MPQSLTDSIVLITGASSGIGAACARAFADAGARLVLAARRRGRLEEIATAFATAHGTATYFGELDVRDADAVSVFIEELPDEFREVDILVNNAGLARGLDKLHEGRLADWNEMIDTNVKGLLHMTRAVVPGMVQRRRGHVINIGSIAGQDVYPKGNVYNASKFAVDAITKGLRMDLVDTPLRVSTVDPGLVESEFSLVRFHGDAARATDVYRDFTACTPDDVAEAVLWCATRPAHVSVNQVVIMPVAQASAMVKHVGPL